MFFIFVRVNACPLPGFTNWKSITTYGCLSIVSLRPLRISDVSYTSVAPLNFLAGDDDLARRAHVPGLLCRHFDLERVQRRRRDAFAGALVAVVLEAAGVGRTAVLADDPQNVDRHSVAEPIGGRQVIQRQGDEAV